MCAASTSNADRRGVTLAELIVAVAVTGLLMAVVVPLFTALRRGYASLEADHALPAAGREALDGIRRRVVRSRRIFDDTAAGRSFLARLPALSPPALAGSRLPVASPGMSLSVGAGLFISTHVGNSFFFAGASDREPAGTGPVELHAFHYYYLAQNAGATLAGSPALELREWHSLPYADAAPLLRMAAPARAAAGLALYVRGCRFAWDASSNGPAAAFFVLSSTGGLVASPDHRIQAGEARPAIALAAGFRFGVSRNTGAGSSHAVPLYAAVSGDFPGGFEAVVVGPSAQREVLLRLVTVAQGAFRGLKSYESVVVTGARDAY